MTTSRDPKGHIIFPPSSHSDIYIQVKHLRYKGGTVLFFHERNKGYACIIYDRNSMPQPRTYDKIT